MANNNAATANGPTLDPNAPKPAEAAQAPASSAPAPAAPTSAPASASPAPAASAKQAPPVRPPRFRRVHKAYLVTAADGREHAQGSIFDASGFDAALLAHYEEEGYLVPVDPADVELARRCSDHVPTP